MSACSYRHNNPRLDTAAEDTLTTPSAHGDRGPRQQCVRRPPAPPTSAPPPPSPSTRTGPARAHRGRAGSRAVRQEFQDQFRLRLAVDRLDARLACRDVIGGGSRRGHDTDGSAVTEPVLTVRQVRPSNHNGTAVRHRPPVATRPSLRPRSGRRHMLPPQYRRAPLAARPALDSWAAGGSATA
jgi:hypothetical protein